MGTTPGLAGEILAVYAFWHRRYDIFGDSLWRILSGTVGGQSDAFFYWQVMRSDLSVTIF